VDVLAVLHRAPVPPGFPVYAHDDMAGRAALSVTWYRTGTGAAPDPAGAEALAAEVATLLARHAPGHGVVALRDYHAENLIWLPGRAGAARVGLLDFQDTMAGHPAYDLISLIEDARRDVSPTLRAPLIARYLEATGAEAEPFAAACAVLAAQRNLRILGVFARLCLHWGKPQYLDLMPRVWAHLARDLEHPALAALRRLVADLLPPPEPAGLDRMREARGTWPMR
jgi:aminoglycoside/choline kinase family phosphotransferase